MGEIISGCGVPKGFALETYQIMGKYGMFLTDDGVRMPSLRASTLTETDRKILWETGQDVYRAHLEFIAKGDMVPGSSYVSPAKPFDQYETEADGVVTFEDMGSTYTEFRVDWAARTCQHKLEGTSGFEHESTRVRRSSSNAKSYGVYWGCDTMVTTYDEKLSTEVALYLIDWDKQCIYWSMSDMASASEDAKGILDMIAALGDYEAVLAWHQAKETYSKAVMDTIPAGANIFD